MSSDGFTTCLWFDGQAEEAAAHYVSIFKNSRIGRVTHYGEGAPRSRPVPCSPWTSWPTASSSSP